MDLTPAVLATTNPAKLERLRWLLEGSRIEMITPGELPSDQIPSSAECGSSHEEIARHKALTWSQSTSLLAIASDGGLQIPALGRSWTSLLTRRFAGETANDRDRSQALLELMHPLRGNDRRAVWIEAVAIAQDSQCLASWEVEGAEGLLVEEIPNPAKNGGFWAFPLWLIPSLDKTYDQLQQWELDLVQDHWTQLKSHVSGFFSTCLDASGLGFTPTGSPRLEIS